MSRKTDLNDVIFPVELADLYITGGSKVPNFKALINSDTKRTFAVVSKNYRLVENKEAVEIGKQCFKILFNTTNTENFEIFNIITPTTKSYCHIDIIHKGYEVNVSEKEVWLPYIRITNSYNKTKALRFDLGFCREICDNGVIFEKETLKIQYYHTKQQLLIKNGNFEISFKKLKKLETEFLEYMKNLKRYHVPEDFVLPIICKALNINFDLNADDQQRREKQADLLEKFISKGNKIIRSYYEEMGPTAYTLLNIISDIASKPIIKTGPGIMIDTYQKRTGAWVNNFIQEIEQKNFDFKQYLGHYLTFFPSK